MRIAVIDYGSGNLRSAARAAEKAAVDAGLSADIQITDRAADIARADKIILPGQGAFGDCIEGLSARPDMVQTLTEAVRTKKKPFLGICVGMQLMAQRGLEHGTHKGLGWIEGEVTRLSSNQQGLKLPHMGWNTLSLNLPHPVLQGLPAEAHVYFVHSYKFVARDTDSVIASCTYGERFAAIIAQENMVGMQFHPEKSQAHGLRLIMNFISWSP